MVGVDGLPHQLDDLPTEQWIQSRIVDPEGLVPTNPQVNKPRPLEFRGEGTLRHGSRHSPRPGAWVIGYLRGQVSFEGEVGDTNTATGSKDAKYLGQGAALAGGEIKDTV
jgi:hypothetical protein